MWAHEWNTEIHDMPELSIWIWVQYRDINNGYNLGVCRAWRLYAILEKIRRLHLLVMSCMSCHDHIFLNFPIWLKNGLFVLHKFIKYKIDHVRTWMSQWHEILNIHKRITFNGHFKCATRQPIEVFSTNKWRWPCHIESFFGNAFEKPSI